MRDGKPVLGKGGRPIVVAYDPKPARNWKATAQGHMIEVAKEALLLQPLAGPVSLFVLAVFTCPASQRRKREPLPRRWHTKRPDADNVLKAVKDSAKGILWLDDAQVCSESCVKIIGAQGEAPYVEITVRTLETLSKGGDGPAVIPAAGAELPLFEET